MCSTCFRFSALLFFALCRCSLPMIGCWSFEGLMQWSSNCVCRPRRVRELFAPLSVGHCIGLTFQFFLLHNTFTIQSIGKYSSMVRTAKSPSLIWFVEDRRLFFESSSLVQKRSKLATRIARLRMRRSGICMKFKC